MPEVVSQAVVARSPVRSSLWASVLFGMALLLIFHQTTWSMVSIWLRSGTFTHGFLILPISLWLAWNKLESLTLINSHSAPWVTLLMIPPGFVWLLATLVDVLVIQQLALVTMLVTGVWAILGHRLACALSFPLLFLFFTVPMGEALVPPMMELTATSTVWMIQQTGIPVYREGLYFTLPSGNWSVVEACSGVRYIIASITLGALYAYLTYRSTWRRILFVLVSAVVPVFANTVRAYLIVMLGHFSDMKIATGVDHLIYGWVFFGLVVFLMFWLGSFFREDQDPAPVRSGGSAEQRVITAPGGTARANLLVSLVALAVGGAWYLLAVTLQSHALSPARGAIELPGASSAWTAMRQPVWGWRPDARAAGQEVAYYDHNGQNLGLYVQYVDGTEDSSDADVVGSSARFAVKDSGWRVADRRRVTVQMAGHAIIGDEALLVGAGGQLLAWSWYRVGDFYTSNDYAAKFLQAWASLGLGLPGSYRIVIAIPLQESKNATQLLLQDFLDKHGARLNEALNRASVEAR